ncbi:ABC transporter ATP-binding protein [Candidatus Protofrankia californiensis]|uniref:ABC transporter ATP-binding protein n=1 Tax=Candidatus Protofrankia californiensis TaxID=1839754 RepID=A0A1C3PGA1_9ACTN|nr:ABC transporter ATP-binding protein [Candidatus Protofrankia californiensis]
MTGTSAGGPVPAVAVPVVAAGGEPDVTRSVSSDPALVVVEGLVVGPLAGGEPTVGGVGFTMRAGEVVALVGPSGSGKTTTALTLLGFQSPGLRLRAGTVRVAGRDMLRPGVAGRMRGRTVAYLGQDPAASLNPARRIGGQLREAVRARVRGPRAEVDAEVARLLTAVRLPAERAFLRRYGHEISGGQAQRVAFAVTLAGDPDVLVLDEPTANLDPVLGYELRQLIVEAVGHRATVLVSHDPYLVRAVADRVLRLDAGRIVAIGHPDEVMPARTLRSRRAGAAADGGSDGADGSDGSPVTAPAQSREPAVLRVVGLSARHGRAQVLRGVDLAPRPGGCLAVVGPSGSGKSTLARVLVGLHTGGRSGGVVELDRVELAPRVRDRSVEQCRGIQLVAQDSVGALNPRETVGAALARPLSLNGTGSRCRGRAGRDTAEVTRADVKRLLAQVRLPVVHADRYPAQLSGGERARVNLARALACRPRVLVCDEVGAALDVDTGEAIMGLLARLRRALGLTVLLITHDLDTVAAWADRVVVLDGGVVVEEGNTAALLCDPRHPTTRALLAATR